jgi:hypothetical protein
MVRISAKLAKYEIQRLIGYSFEKWAQVRRARDSAGAE